jgi:hypothetical protein
MQVRHALCSAYCTPFVLESDEDKIDVSCNSGAPDRNLTEHCAIGRASQSSLWTSTDSFAYAAQDERSARHMK